MGLGLLTSFQGDYPRAEALLAESLALCRAVGDPLETAHALLCFGASAQDLGDYEQATQRLEEALAMYQDLRGTVAPVFASNALTSLGVTAYLAGNLELAAARLEEALGQQRALGFTWNASQTLGNLGDIRRDQGDYPRALAFYQESLLLVSEHRDRRIIAAALAGVASVALALGQLEPAARLFGAAEALREAIGTPPDEGLTRFHQKVRSADLIRPVIADSSDPAHRPRFVHDVATARLWLDEDAFVAAWAAGRVLPIEAAIAEALAVAAASDPATAASSGARQAGHGLTPREIEILRLLAAGRSNPEIAAALFISRRTVTTHLTRIFTKLGVARRDEAIARAFRLGLVDA
jgi:non-specific serine/threonine protein kinase